MPEAFNPPKGRSTYEFERYSFPERWGSYYHQLKSALKLEPQSVLEIGIGDRVFGSYLKNNTDITYTSVDYSASLMPDVVASVTKLPLKGDSFDLCCAFEIMEHLPFDDFDAALSELARVSKKDVIISLPHFGPTVQWMMKIPLLPKLRFAWKVPYPKTHVKTGEHFWEIGKRGFPVSRIIGSMEKHFKVKEHFVPFENQYHHFFILEKK